MEISKEVLDALADAALNTGELRAGPDEKSINIASELLAHGFVVIEKSPSKKRTWSLYRVTKDGYNYLMKMEEIGFSIVSKNFEEGILSKDELRKKINNGTITKEEFDKNSEAIFSIITNNFWESKTVPGTEFVLFFDRFKKPITINNDRKDNFIEKMSKFAVGKFSISEMHRFLFETGMCLELCGMFITLLKDSIRLKSMYDEIIKSMDAEDVEMMSTIDKSKMN